MADILVIESKVQNLEKETDKQWNSIGNLAEKIDTLMRKWIPVWVGLVMMAMSGVTASALTVAIMIIRFTSK